MASKLNVLSIFVATACIFCILLWESNATIIRRDVPAATTNKDGTAAIDEALQSFKSGLDDLVKNIQNNELYQNVSASLKQFGDSVQQQGQQLVDKINTNTKKN